MSKMLREGVALLILLLTNVVMGLLVTSNQNSLSAILFEILNFKLFAVAFFGIVISLIITHKL